MTHPLFDLDRPFGAGDRCGQRRSARRSRGRLAAAGAAVLVTDMDEDAASAVAQRICAAGGTAGRYRPRRPRPPAADRSGRTRRRTRRGAHCTSWSITPE